MATLLEKFTAWTGMEPASKSPIAEMIVKSTDPLLMGPDWASNLEVADLVNTYESEGAKEAIKCLRKRLVMERKAQLLALTLLESLMKNCHDSFHVEVASKEFMADLCKVATQRKTDTDVAQQILDLCAGWAAEYGSHPLLGNFARAQANLVAQGVGQHVNFSPLVSAGEGGAAAARPLVASTTSTRGVASHVAEPDSPGQVRLVTAPPAVPTHGGPGMLPPGDAPLAMVADDALPGTMPPPPVAAAIDERAADDEARRRAEADDEEEGRRAETSPRSHARPPCPRLAGAGAPPARAGSLAPRKSCARA